MTKDEIGEIETSDAVASESAGGDENPVAAAIAAAEETTDPLDGLADRVAEDQDVGLCRPAPAIAALFHESLVENGNTAAGLLEPRTEHLERGSVLFF